MLGEIIEELCASGAFREGSPSEIYTGPQGNVLLLRNGGDVIEVNISEPPHDVLEVLLNGQVYIRCNASKVAAENLVETICSWLQL